MSEFNSVEEETRAQMSKLKGRPLKEKIAYYWHYQKWLYLGIIGLTVFIFLLCRTIFTNNQNNYLTGVFMNTTQLDIADESFEDEYIAYTGIDTKKDKIEFDTTLAFHADTPTDSASMYTPTMVDAYSEGETGDFFIADEGTLDYFCGIGLFQNLTEVLSVEQMTAYADRLYYYVPEDSANRIPVGILITDSAKLAETGYYAASEKPVVYSFFYNSKNKEHAVEFLEYLLTE